MNAKEVRNQLAEIMESPEFARSPAMAGFLSYVINETLAGRGEALKEYAVAVEALGRGTDFDPRKSSSVRTLAGRVRAALDGYYAASGNEAHIVIRLPKGRYAPVITPKGFDVGAEAPRQTVDAPPPWVTRVMVAPFTFGDDAPASFAFDVGKEMSGVLAAFDDLDVVSHSVSKTFFERGGEIVDAMRELGAEFVCTGHVQRRKGRILASISLTASPQGRQVWSNEFLEEAAVDGDVDFVNRVTAISAGCIGGFFGIVARERSIPAPRSEAEAAICSALGAFAAAYQQIPSKEMFQDLLEKMETALKTAPGVGTLHAIAAGCRLAGASMGCFPAQRSIAKAGEHISLALSDRRVSACTRFMEGYWRAMTGRLDLARKAYEECLAINPNDIYMIRMCGHGLYVSGDYERGMALIQSRQESNPFFLKYNFLPHIMEFLRNNEYEKALEAADNLYIPGLAWSPLARTTALFYLNRVEEAQAEYQILLDICPDFSSKLEFYVKSVMPAKELQEIFKEALRKVAESMK